MSSSPEHEADINVVSSPEPSPQGHDSGFSLNHFHSLSHHDLRLSPPKSPNVHPPASSLSPSPAATEPNNNSNSANNNNNNKSTLNNGYTSFSISSILSRSEPSKKLSQSMLVAPIPHMPQGVGGQQDAAMLSR